MEQPESRPHLHKHSIARTILSQRTTRRSTSMVMSCRLVAAGCASLKTRGGHSRLCRHWPQGLLYAFGRAAALLSVCVAAALRALPLLKAGGPARR